MSDANPFQLKSSEVKYQNPWITVREDAVVRPGGGDGIFGVVTMADGVTVLPIDDDDNVYLAQEYKYAVERETYEAISGGIDGDETPEQAALRELAEETGFRAREIIPLSYIDPYTTIVKSRNYCFLVKVAERGETRLDDGEIINVVKVPFETAVKWAMNGKISHGASVATILRAKIFIDGKEKI